MNRRRFLKEAATVASAATVAGSLGSPAGAEPQAPARPLSVPPSPVPDQDPPAETDVLSSYAFVTSRKKPEARPQLLRPAR